MLEFNLIFKERIVIENMGRLEEYVEKQEQVILIADERINLANYLYQNILKPEFFQTASLKIHNINFPRGEESVGTLKGRLIKSDQVYAKLSEAMIDLHFNKRGYEHEGIIHKIINDLQIDIENRKMGEEVYAYLLKTPKERLIQDWLRKIDEDTVPF